LKPDKHQIIQEWKKAAKKAREEDKPLVSFDDYVKDKLGDTPENLGLYDGESPKSFEEFVKEYKSNPSLEEIYNYLGLHENNVQGKQKIKIQNLRRVIALCYDLEQGHYNEWIDRLSIPLGLSTRKVREDYIDPLISIRIVYRDGFNMVRFLGVPKNKEE
jgi:hypothetical protein